MNNTPDHLTELVPPSALSASGHHHRRLVNPHLPDDVFGMLYGRKEPVAAASADTVAQLQRTLRFPPEPEFEGLHIQDAPSFTGFADTNQ